ncbi:MAG: hemolysin III family protein [Victivallaceae bacterium]|nr:hemolysin III family protein [Victivallaceae bacterium]
MNIDASFQDGERVINFYSRREEVANAATHGFGICAALAAIPILCVFAYGLGARTVISVLVYAVTLLAMYIFSTAYHIACDDRWKLFLRRLDYCSIYLLIAGTYTPLLALTVGGMLGWGILIGLWVTAAFGIVVKCFTMKECGGLSLYLYLAMGWGGIACMKALLTGMTSAGIFCMFAGGLAYTIGIIFFLNERQYSHTLWHLFVMLGTMLHFIMVLTLL